MEEKKNSLTPEEEKKIKEENQQFLRDFEFACADPRGGVGFSYTEHLRGLLRRKVVELRRAEERGADKESLKAIGIKYVFAAEEVFRMTVEILSMLRKEFFREYEEEVPPFCVDIAFGVYNLPEGIDQEDVWNSIKDFYKDYCGDTEPIRIVQYRGCYLPELDHPYCMSSGIVAPKSIRKISEFFGLVDPVTDADATEYMDLDSIMDWDFEIMRTIDVFWLFNVQDTSYDSDMKLKACFDYGNHPWFNPGKWYRNLSIKKFNPADEADAKEILEQ